MIFTKTYKSGTIFLSILITLIIGVFSTSLIVLVYYYRTSTNKLLIEKRLLNNINSTVVLLLDSNLVFNDSINNIDLYDNNSDSVFVKKTDWGLFTNYEISARYNNFKKNIIIQTGIKQNTPPYAIYLYSNSRPLTLLGNTIIKGTCYLSEAGIKTSYFDKNEFTGTIPNDNEIKLNNTFYPSFSSSLKDKINKCIMDVNENTTVDIHTINKYKNSFHNENLLMYSINKIILNEDSIIGRIIIKSEKCVEITKQSYLEDVIIIAPVVKINSNCSGNLQIFATDSIIVSNDCNFNYPTALYLDSKTEKSTIINIEDNSVINGYVILLNNSADPYVFSSINIAKNAIVRGLVYTDQFVDIKGSIVGSITCNKFILRTISSVYDNYVLNAKIDYYDLPKYFINAGIFSTKSKNEQAIVKYVNY